MQACRDITERGAVSAAAAAAAARYLCVAGGSSSCKNRYGIVSSVIAATCNTRQLLLLFLFLSFNAEPSAVGA